MLRCTLRTITLVLAFSPALLSSPASAACHLADFTEHEVRVDEDERRVTLTVHLVGGQPECAGTVRYETVDGTAKSPRDYERADGLLTFVAGDDREETITVRIRDDERSDGNGRFEVRLREGQGTISPSSTPAVVTIADDEPAPSPTRRKSTRPTSTADTTADTDAGSSTGLVLAIIAAVIVLGLAGWLMTRRRTT